MPKSHLDNETLAIRLRKIAERNLGKFSDTVSYFPDDAIDEERRKKCSPVGEELHTLIFEELSKLPPYQQQIYKNAFMALDDIEQDTKAICNALNECPTLATLLHEKLDILDKEFPPSLFTNSKLQHRMREILGCEEADDLPSSHQEIIQLYHTLPEDKRITLSRFLFSTNEQSIKAASEDLTIRETADRLSSLLQKISLNELPTITISSPAISPVAVKLNAVAGRDYTVSYHKEGILDFSIKVPAQTKEQKERQATSLAQRIARLPQETISYLELSNNRTLRTIVTPPISRAAAATGVKMPVTATQYTGALQTLRYGNSESLADFLVQDPRARHYIENYIELLEPVKKVAAHQNSSVEFLSLGNNPSLRNAIKGTHFQQKYRQALDDMKEYNISPLAEFLATQPEAKRIIINYAESLPAISPASQPTLSHGRQPGQLSIKRTPTSKKLAELPETRLRSRSHSFHSDEEEEEAPKVRKSRTRRLSFDASSAPSFGYSSPDGKLPGTDIAAFVLDEPTATSTVKLGTSPSSVVETVLEKALYEQPHHQAESNRCDTPTPSKGYVNSTINTVQNGAIIRR